MSWRATEEDTWLQPLVSTHTVFIHLHPTHEHRPPDNFTYVLRQPSTCFLSTEAVFLFRCVKVGPRTLRTFPVGYGAVPSFTQIGSLLPAIALHWDLCFPVLLVLEPPLAEAP